jgi:hypothetical protein
MTVSVQRNVSADKSDGVFQRNSRATWISSKIAQLVSIEAERLEAVHNHIMLAILAGNDAACSPSANESEQLAAKIVAVARVAETAAALGGSAAAMAAVMRESGRSIDPLLAQNFLRVASSPIFWMALDSVSEAGAN